MVCLRSRASGGAARRCPLPLTRAHDQRNDRSDPLADCATGPGAINIQSGVAALRPGQPKTTTTMSTKPEAPTNGGRSTSPTPPAVSAATYGKIDAAAAGKPAWMTRIPPKLAQAFEEAPEGTVLGTFTFTKGGSLPAAAAAAPAPAPAQLQKEQQQKQSQFSTTIVRPRRFHRCRRYRCRRWERRCSSTTAR